MKFKPVEKVLKNGCCITIREAVRKDAPELIKVISQYLKESSFLISSPDEFNPTTLQQENWIHLLNNSENSILLVAEYRGKIIANIDLKGENRRKVKHNTLMGIGVLSTWQNLGIGTLLLDSVIGWARNNSTIESVWLNVFEGHSEAIKLYEKMGFKKVGIQPDYIKNNDGTYYRNFLMVLSVK